MCCIARKGDAAMKIAIGCDHAGFAYKEKIKALLTELGHEVYDYGTDSEEPADYPRFVRPRFRRDCLLFCQENYL